MTAGNNGASTPEDDDPFGYLYEDGQAAAANQRRQGGTDTPVPQPSQVYRGRRTTRSEPWASASTASSRRSLSSRGTASSSSTARPPTPVTASSRTAPRPCGPYGAPAAPHASESTSRVPLQRAGWAGPRPQRPQHQGPAHRRRGGRRGGRDRNHSGPRVERRRRGQEQRRGPDGRPERRRVGAAQREAQPGGGGQAEGTAQAGRRDPPAHPSGGGGVRHPRREGNERRVRVAERQPARRRRGRWTCPRRGRTPFS